MIRYIVLAAATCAALAHTLWWIQLGAGMGAVTVLLWAAERLRPTEVADVEA